MIASRNRYNRFNGNQDVIDADWEWKVMECFGKSGCEDEEEEYCYTSNKRYRHTKYTNGGKQMAMRPSGVNELQDITYTIGVD